MNRQRQKEDKEVRHSWRITGKTTIKSNEEGN